MSMLPPYEKPELPSSYATLDLPHIKVAHHPESSTEVTPVVVIYLYRPKNNNAFTLEMLDSMVEVYRLINQDDRVKAVVLTGHGKLFCAGADLDISFMRGGSRKSLMQRAELERDTDFRDTGGRITLAIHQCSKPTVAAIQGSAVGVGITMCLPAAIRVVYSKAKIGFVFNRRGIVMEACSSFFLPKLIGMSRALHLTTTGQVYPADHPLMRELFSELLPTPEATLQRGLELADEVAKNTSLVSNKLMRDLMYHAPASAEETHLLDSKIIHGVLGGPDNQEGVKSFLEKRPADFKGTMTKNAPGAWPWWPQIDIGYVPKAKDRANKL